MVKLITFCPSCGQRNKVVNTLYMRLDECTSVTCKKCGLHFRTILSDEDIRKLFRDDSVVPVVSTGKDYTLKSEFINL